MRLRTTLLLLLLTGGLLAWILLHERKGPGGSVDGMLLFDFDQSEEEAAEKNPPAGQKPDRRPRAELRADEVGQIDVKGTAGQATFTKRRDGTWLMTKGLRDRADRDFVNQLLHFCETAAITDTLDRDELKRGDVTEASLGLDKSSRVEVTFKRPGGERFAEIHLGRTAPLGGAMYVRVDYAVNDWQRRRPDIYLVAPDLRDQIARPLDAFRDPRVAPWGPEQVQKIEIVVGDSDGKLEIARDTIDPRMEAPWYIASPFRSRADQTVVTRFLQILCGTRILAFKPASSNVTPPDPAAARPLAQVTLWTSPEVDRKGSTLVFFADDTAPESKRVLCRDPERKAEFYVDRGLVDDLRQADGANTFRDPFLGLGGIPQKLVSTVLVAPSEGDFAELVRIGEKWSVRRKDATLWEDAESSFIGKLLKKLDQTEILQFTSDSMTDPAPYGLDAPWVSVTFGAPVHQSVEKRGTLTPQNSRTLRLSQLADGKCFANYEGEPFVYRVAPETLGDVPRSFLKWRSLRLPGFSVQQVRRIRQTIGVEPPVELTNDGRSSIWKAVQGGEDISARVQPLAVSQLTARLGSLQASGWQSSPAEADDALKIPALSIDLDLEVFEEKGSRIETVTLSFSPFHSGQRSLLFHARHSKVSDAFLMDGTTVGLLMQPLVK